MNTLTMIAMENEKRTEFNQSYNNLLMAGRTFIYSVSAASVLVYQIGSSRTVSTISKEFAEDMLLFLKTFKQCIDTAKRIDNLLVVMEKLHNVKLLEQYFDHLKDEVVHNQGVMVEVYEKATLVMSYLNTNITFFAENGIRFVEFVVKCGDIVNKQKEFMRAITHTEFGQFYLENT